MNNTHEKGKGFDCVSQMYETWMDFNFKMMKDSMEIATNWWDIDNSEKFYSIWSKNMSEMLEKMMRTPGFTENSWNLFKSTSGIQQFYRMLSNMYLKTLDVPDREEIDELSERINYLDDKLEKIEEILETISEQLKSSGNNHQNEFHHIHS
jgi:hypothetical protein